MSKLNTQSGSVLELWLQCATCRLSASSAAQVRAEIQEHYESARDEALICGASAEEADRRAMAALGDARTVNRYYRKVLVTSAEDRLLRETQWEARAVCSRRGWLMLIPAVAGLCAGIWLLAAGDTQLALALLIGAAGPALLFTSPWLPLRSAARARVFRGIRWAWLAAVLLAAVWPDVVKLSWLLAACAWPIIWVEWTLFSLRRKLPVAQWPTPLYL